MDFLAGYKTYATAAVAVIYAVSAALFGAIDANTAMEIIFGAIGGASLRAALGRK